MRVLKPITTPKRRIAAGAEITADDLDGPLSVADWRRLGHLAAPPEPAKPVKVAPAVAPTDSALSD